MTSRLPYHQCAIDPQPDEYTHSSSNNSVTPTRDNTAQELLFSDAHKTSNRPESTNLPILDTISLPSVKIMSRNNGGEIRIPSSTGNEGISPRSIDNLNNLNSQQQQQQQQQMQTNGGRHRRPPQSRNQEFFQPQQQPQQLYYHIIPNPPMQGGSYQGQYTAHPTHMSPNPQMLPSPRYTVQGVRHQQSVSHQMPIQAHHQTHTVPTFHPPPGVSPAGNPLIPILPEADGRYSASPMQSERKRLHSAVGPQGHRRTNSGNEPVSAMRHHGHRRTHSGNVLGSTGGRHGHRRTFSGNAPPIYGSFDEGLHSRQQASSGFSPRSEIMKLSKGYSSRTMQQQQPPMSPGNAFNRGGMSPLSSSMRHQGHQPETLHVSFSPGTPIRDAGHAITLAPKWESQEGPDSPEYLGEATYQSNRRNKSRKMHMRQQSAQLFMEPVKGVKQEPACRDMMFVFLFLLHLVGMAYLGITYGHYVYIGEKQAESNAADVYTDDTTIEKVLTDLTDETVAVSYRNVIYVTCLCGLFGVATSTLAMVIMTIIAKRLVQVALILTISLSFAWGTIGIGVSPQNVVPITGIIALMLSVGYTFIVWDRIPFAAANLQAGLSGIKANAGTVVIAFAFQGLSLVWTIYFTHVVIGIYNALKKGDLVLSNHMTIFVYAMLSVSYYWTYHVFMNIVQVTVAGAIGSWWFSVDGNSSCWKDAVTTSFFSAISSRFGSICFGSLLVGPVRLLHMMASLFRPSSDDSALTCMHEFLNCVHQCISGCCVDQLTNRFSPWALTYVGLYGYSLLDAGAHATELFEKRGWTMIVSDDLIPNVLLLVSVVVGGVTGCFGMLIQKMDELSFTSIHEPVVTAFLIGVCIGWVVTSVLFGIISSSVNAVIVCFAGNPVEFDSNHPDLSAEMKSAWREVWPGCMDVIDMRAENAEIVYAQYQHARERHPLL